MHTNILSFAFSFIAFPLFSSSLSINPSSSSFRTLLSFYQSIKDLTLHIFGVYIEYCINQNENISLVSIYL